MFAAFKKSNAARPAVAAAPPRTASAPPAVDGSNLGQLMARLRAAASEQQPTIAGFLDGGRITDMEGGTVTLDYPRHLETSAKMLDRNGKRENLQNVLAGLLGHTVGVRFTVNDDAPPDAPSAEARHATWKPPATPVSAPESPQPVAAPAANGIAITEELRVELLQQNPLIRSLAEQFNARVVKVEE